ncbi:hypothetical protein HY091_00665 [Candidatus Kaiserbacteria bacterium]|nr:hypothetical protein [Candidatus Kaiserbacteria bacterium]
MNIEELSKSQLILLTILVNFVTSVATGILTVSLLDQAPPFVTQTVNRVVEHTIETVAAAPAAAITAPAPSDQDLVTNALAASSARFALIYDPKIGTSTPAIAIGTYLPKARAVVTATQSALPQEALVEFPDGSFVPASVSHADQSLTIYGFADSATLPKAVSPVLVAAKDLKLGETALAITTDGAATTGIISRVADDGVHTTLPNIGSGSSAVDLLGNLIGIAAGVTPGLLVSADQVRVLLSATTTAATPSH